MKKVIIALLTFIGIIGVAYFIFRGGDSDLIVNKWDNINNEECLNFYYDDKDNSTITKLEKEYKIKELTKDKASEQEKVEVILDIVNRAVSYDDVASVNLSNGFDILNEKKNMPKVSRGDMAIITRDMLKSIGLTARIGEFRNMSSIIEEQENYFVTEYWSKQYNKWVMVDFENQGYFMSENIPLSAIEVINTDIGKCEYKGKRERKDYLKILKSYLKTYSIWIDNTISKERSNSQLTYITKPKYITLDYKATYLPPTIFTENANLFNGSPLENKKAVGEKAYIILMKRANKEATGETSPQENKEEVVVEYMLAAFKGDKVISNYYVKINGEEYENVNRYFELKLKKGINTITISEDGVNDGSKIEIEVKNIENIK